jgi:hypothetical protein
MYEIFLIGKEIAGLDIGISDVFWIDLGPVQFNEIGAAGLELIDKFFLVAASRFAHDGNPLNGIECGFNPLLERLFDLVPISGKQDIVLLVGSGAERRLRNKAIIYSPLLGKITLFISLRLDPVFLFDVSDSALKSAAVELWKFVPWLPKPL